jgi:hypothetical protein
MRPVGEGQVASGTGAADVECVRIREHRRIPVRPGQRHRHLVARPDAGRAEPRVAGRVPVDHGRGGLEPQRFLDRRRYQAAVPQHETELGGVGQQVPHRVGDHAFGRLYPAEHQDGRVGDRLRLGQRPGGPGGLGQRRGTPRCRDDAPQGRGQVGKRRRALVAAVTRRASRGLGLDGGHDPVVPGEDRGRVGLPEAERLGHDRGRQRPGDRAAELGLSARADGRHQAARLGAGERGEAGVNLLGPEGPGEGAPVPRMLPAVQRQHAGADHGGGGEPRVVDGERPPVAQDLNGEVVPGDEPGPEDRYPAGRRGAAEAGEHRVGIGLQLVQGDLGHRGPR